MFRQSDSNHLDRLLFDLIAFGLVLAVWCLIQVLK
jgi:hypothetical protein